MLVKDEVITTRCRVEIQIVAVGSDIEQRKNEDDLRSLQLVHIISCSSRVYYLVVSQSDDEVEFWSVFSSVTETR
jgi:hypothetical protein